MLTFGTQNAIVIIKELKNGGEDMKSSRVGRPVVGKPKIHDIKVRVDEAMHSKILKVAEEKSTTKAEVIRQAIAEYVK